MITARAASPSDASALQHRGSASIRLKFSAIRDSGVANSSSRKNRPSSSIAALGVDRHYLDSARQSSAHRHDAWPCRRMADSLHAMAVRVQHERAVVVGMILWSQPRRTTVASATGKRRRIKSVYRPAIGSAKTQMRARNWSFDFAFLGDRKFDTERTRCSTIVRASVLAEVNDAYKPERA